MALFIRSGLDMVEATQWLPGREVAGVAGEAAGQPGGGGLLPSPPHAYLATPRGRLTVFAGDWVVTEPTGEQHLYPDALFQERYTPALTQEHAPDWPFFNK